jgi:quinol monooxygenase YgiN
MVHVALTMTFDRRRTAEMIQTLQSLMLPLPAEPGFISCRLCQEADHDNTICYEEQWQTSQALDHQIRSNRYTRLLTLMDEATEPPDLRLNWVTEVKGLEYLEAVRLFKENKP